LPDEAVAFTREDGSTAALFVFFAELRVRVRWCLGPAVEAEPPPLACRVLGPCELAGVLVAGVGLWLFVSASLAATGPEPELGEPALTLTDTGPRTGAFTPAAVDVF
jgi:hypothetical protein